MLLKILLQVVFRAMGAKIGRRVYWPGSGIYCPDPELLEIGDEVVFGSCSGIFTTYRIGSRKVVMNSEVRGLDRAIAS